MISFNHISKDFKGVEVLKDISMEVEKGELLVLLGASGSGKTTLLKMINGLEKPSKGEIYINGKSLKEAELTELRKKIGYVIQQVGLFPHYTIYENIALVPRLKKQDQQLIDENVRLWMDKLGLSFEVQSQKLPNALSGGQAQRVGLARALIAQPQMILMDEPFSALDPISRVQIRNDFRKIQQKEKITAVMVTHDLLEAVSLADRICLIGNKKIQQIASPAELIFHPANKYVKEFIQSDQFQAELNACKMEFLLPYLDEGTIAIKPKNSVLQLLQKADDKESKLLMQAFYKWKEDFK